MTPAAFDTRRRYLGLSIEETARLCGVQDRAIRRWQLGTSPIPQDVIETLDELEDAMHKAVEQATELATDMVEKGPVVLWRYRTQEAQNESPHAGSMPLGAHAIMTAWACDALEAEGIEVEILWSDQGLDP